MDIIYRLITTVFIIFVLMVATVYGYSKLTLPTVDERQAELTARWNSLTTEEIVYMSIQTFDECRARGGEVIAKPLQVTPIGLASTGYRCSKYISLEEFLAARL